MGNRQARHDGPTSEPLHLLLDVRHSWASALHVALAVPLGLFADIGLRADGSVIFIFAAATPWILLAFSAGRATELRWSAGAGALVILIGLCSYYAWLNVNQGVDSGILFGHDYAGGLWLKAGMAMGAITGLAGGLTRVGRPLVAELAWSGLAAVPVGDCFVMLRYYTIEGWLLPTTFAVGVVLAIFWWATRAGARVACLVMVAPLAFGALAALEVAALHAVHRLT